MLAGQLIGATALAEDAAHKNCLCRANDKKYEQGQILCLHGRLARCEMNLNNPSWKIIAPSCPETSLEFPQVTLAFGQSTIAH